MNLGVAAFWIFIAAVVVAGIWKKKHSETLRHETMRLLIEKNHKIDEAQLAELLNPKPAEWTGLQSKPSKPGDAYRALRIIGTLLMFLALGFLLVGLWRGMILGIQEKSVLGLAVVIPVIAMVGVGLFVASRYVAPPSDDAKNR